MTSSSPSELRLQAAVRDYIRDVGEGGIASDWLLIAHFLPADGVGDSYYITGRDGIPEHAARGLVDYAKDNIYEYFGPPEGSAPVGVYYYDEDGEPYDEDEDEEPV